MKRLLLGYAAVALVAGLILGVLPFLLKEPGAGPGTAPRQTAAAPDLAAPDPATPVPAAPVPAGTATEAAAPDTPAAADLTAAILADLARPATPAPPPGPPDPLAAMSAAVLADLYGLQPGSGPASAGPLADLVRQAVAEGQSPAYVDALVNEAAARGRVEVPPLLRTTEGRVDTAVLLAGLGLAEDETGEGDAAARDLAADPVSARLDLGPATYTVLPGDSLSALALRYYGDAARATEIHAANLSVLATADSLHVGQKLVLPQR